MFLGNKYPADLYIVYRILLISRRHSMGFLYMYHGNLARRRLNDILRKIKTVWPPKDTVVPFIKAMSLKDVYVLKEVYNELYRKLENMMI